MANIRTPKQRRSIEKKKSIAKAGFELFCEKGYHKTTTIEIAERAGISIGALYSYFRDKRDIYIAAFEQYLESFSNLLFEELEHLPNPFNLSIFIDKWILCYIDLFCKSGKVLAQLRMMMLEDEEINNHFCDFEHNYISKIVEILNQNSFISDNLFEKVYACSILVDALNQEKSVFPHRNLSFAVLKCQIAKGIYHLLST
jgi:AcrR family transcriptional regulator